MILAKYLNEFLARFAELTAAATDFIAPLTEDHLDE